MHPSNDSLQPSATEARLEGPVETGLLRGAMPSLQLPSQPFANRPLPPEDAPLARPSFENPTSGAHAGPLVERHDAAPLYTDAPAVIVEHVPDGVATSEEHRPLQGLQQFHQAVSDRRSADRGTSERRSTPRPYASPWMARPTGSIDPRPVASPDHAQDSVIRALDTVVPALPIPADETPVISASSFAAAAPPAPAPTPEPAPASAPEANASPPAAALAMPSAPAVEPTPIAPTAAAPTTAGDPLGGVFGAPSAVRFAVINPSAWFPTSGDMTPPAARAPAAVAPPAPAVTAAPTAPPAPMTPAVGASPWADRAPAPQPSPVASALQLPSAPAPAPKPWVESRPPIQGGGPAAPAAFAISTTSPTTPAPAPLSPLATQITGLVALQPGASAASQARAGSTIVRFAWMIAAPAAAGGGIGYLLSLVLR